MQPSCHLHRTLMPARLFGSAAIAKQNPRTNRATLPCKLHCQRRHRSASDLLEKLSNLECLAAARSRCIKERHTASSAKPLWAAEHKSTPSITTPRIHTLHQLTHASALVVRATSLQVKRGEKGGKKHVGATLYPCYLCKVHLYGANACGARALANSPLCCVSLDCLTMRSQHAACACARICRMRTTAHCSCAQH